jgi:hypothetical protein
MIHAKLIFIGVASGVVLGTALFLSLAAAGRGKGPATDAGQRTPVLVELFTSEGCSDCPPADALLGRLDSSQPVAGTELVVLSEHVDYWDDSGWKDPYSSREYTERQGAYANFFGLRGVYTPQMVVDGHIELVGSDERGALEAIQKAAKAEKIPVTLSEVHLEGRNTVALHIETAALPSGFAAETVNVMLAVADDSDQSQVSRGENAGRTLTHVAVVRTLVPVGKIDKASGISQDTRVHFNSENPRNLRLVAFAQDKTGRIVGVGSARQSN